MTYYIFLLIYSSGPEEYARSILRHIDLKWKDYNYCGMGKEKRTKFNGKR